MCGDGTMSRIGKKPISIPEKVVIQIKDGKIELKGPGGSLTKSAPSGVEFKIQDKQVVVTPKDPSHPMSGSLYGLARTLVANMVQGVVTPWKKDLEIQGVGYRATKNGQTLSLALGYSHPIDFKVPDTIQFSVDAKQVLISMSSPDKELLGTVASQIRGLRAPEPYKGKGVRYLGEHIMRKAGKAAGAVGGGTGKK